MKFQTFEDIVAALPQIQTTLKTMSGMLRSNLVMIGEIPSPTFGEQRRVDFLKDRFNEAGLLNCSIDDMPNIYGILPGETGKQNILMIAHLDTVFEEEDYSISVLPEKIIGQSVADNSLGIAADRNGREERIKKRQNTVLSLKTVLWRYMKINCVFTFFDARFVS